MYTAIDWVSFSFEVGQGGKREAGWQWEDVEAALHAFLPNTGFDWLDAQDWEVGKGRAPYAQSWGSEENGVRFFWSGKLDHALCEVSGRGCARLTERGWLASLLNDAQARLTRLDICSDIETEVEPSEFVAAGYSERIKSHASYHSPTGSTEYIGSRSSDRFARVYRYVAPHPRSHLLRIEHELKKDAARAAAAWMLAYGIESVQASIGEGFGWLHPLWKPTDQSAGKISAPRNDRTLAKTELWLRSQAAPAFVKLYRAGLVDDPEQWLRDVFLKALDSEPKNVLLL